MLRPFFMIRMHPSGELTDDGPYEKEEAETYVRTFNRVMKGTGMSAEIVEVTVNSPTTDPRDGLSQ